MTAIRPIPTPDRRPRALGFTLIELLVVILIVGLISAVTLPAVVTAIADREVSDAAATFQATLANARDNATRAGTSRGVRLLPDPDLTDVSKGVVVANRMVAIEQAPEYNVGRCFLRQYRHTLPGYPQPISIILAVEDKSYMSSTPPPAEGAAPTSWYWNIRVGERLKLGNSGRVYKVIGPVRTPPGARNPEGFVNLDDPAGTASTPRVVSLPTTSYPPQLIPPALAFATGAAFDPAVDNEPVLYINNFGAEYLFLANGIDDDRDGLIDEQFDGIDNDNDTIADPAFGGVPGVLDPMPQLVRNYNGNPGLAYTGEYEPETLDRTVTRNSQPYTITRRPVVSEGAREVPLPANMVIDLTLADWRVVTTSSTFTNLFNFAVNNGGIPPERSRVPIDVRTLYVDVLFNPAGQIAEDQFNFGVTPDNRGLPAYHFWMANREDVQAPADPPPNNYAQARLLPTPFSAGPGQTPLKKDRRLITLLTKTGDVLGNTIADESFAAPNPNDQRSGIEAIYQPAQSGVREP